MATRAAAAAAGPSASSGGGSSGSGGGGGGDKDAFNAALRSRQPSNSYMEHLKIWETVEGGERKARYLILAVQRDTGRVTINKAKRNGNGSYSIGKDWDLNLLREVIVDEPQHFTITLARSISWQTESARDQSRFLTKMVRVYRKYTGDDSLPRCVGLDQGLQPLAPVSSSSSSSSSSAATVIPSINTAMLGTSDPAQPSQTSPTRSRSSSRQAGGHAPQDAFYDPRANNSNATPSPLPPPSARSVYSNGTAPSTAPLRPRQPSRKESDPSAMPSSPSVNGNLAIPPLASPAVSSDAELPVMQSPAEEKEMLLEDKMIKEEKKEEEEEEQSRATKASTTVAKPRTRPPRSRPSASSSLSVSSQGGDARARLSSIEPVRGGAAYEKMLLAGTGLRGVAEGEEDEEDEETARARDEAAQAAEPDDVLANLKATAKRPPAKSATNVGDITSSSEVGQLDDEDDEDATLLNVEEMLEGFEWSTGARVQGKRIGGGAKGTADVIEARLLDELAALDAANIHAIIESDDRVNLVVGHMEEALNQLDAIDSMIAGFKVQLNSRADDISHIEGQNRGLQVQTSNQRALYAEVEKLLSTVHVDQTAVEALLHVRLDSDEGIAEAEMAGAALYKAMLQAKRTEDEMRGAAGAGDQQQGGMAAATERLSEYTEVADRFAKRLLDFLTDAFNRQTDMILSDPKRRATNNGMMDHAVVEDLLGRYCGLILYVKEVSPAIFSRISAAYFASASERYKGEMTRVFSASKQAAQRATDEGEVDNVEASSFSASGQAALGAGGGVAGAGAGVTALRSNTIRRIGGGRTRNQLQQRSRKAGAASSGSESFSRILFQILPIVSREQAFVSDLLHINDNAVTFADYMDLEPFFRRRAAAIFSLSDQYQQAGGMGGGAPFRDMKGALELIFGFLGPEWQGFADAVLGRDRGQIFGILAALDRAIVLSETLSNDYLLRALQKLHMRLASVLDRFIGDQIRAVEQTKLSVKKRRGVTYFIRVFPVFVDRVESQLLAVCAGSSEEMRKLNIRRAVDGYYEQLSSTMFDALQAMAASATSSSTAMMSGEDEDKGLLNHHVILIENMHFYVTEVGRLLRRRTRKSTRRALVPCVRRAHHILEDSTLAYVHSALRRPLSKMMDFGDGIDGLLRSTPPGEVSLHSAYSKSAAKRLIKEYGLKDVRKSIEVLAKRVAKHFENDADAADEADFGEWRAAQMQAHDDEGGGVGADVDEDGVDEEAEELLGELEELLGHDGVGSSSGGGEVLEKVWRACEEGFVAETERLGRILRDCYATQGFSLEFSLDDVRRFFAAASPMLQGNAAGGGTRR